MIKYFFKALTFLISLIFIASTIVVIITNNKVNFNKLRASLDKKYTIFDSNKYEISYFPYPSVKASNVKIMEGNKLIIEAKEVEVGFTIPTILNLILSNNISQNIDFLKVSNGKVIIDNFINFSANQKFIDKVQLENVALSTDYLDKINVINEEGEKYDYNFGVVNLELSYTFGRYKFKGDYINNQKLTLRGEYNNYLQLNIFGEGVEINLTPNEALKNSNVKLDIKNFKLINNTILDNFPEYIKNNLENEIITLDGLYSYDKGTFKINNVDGSIIKGSGTERLLSNGVNVSLLQLEYLKWGKKFDTVHDNFFLDVIVNYDSVKTNGFAILAKQVNLHGSEFDGLKLFVVKNDEKVVLQEFKVGNNDEYIEVKANYLENIKSIEGDLNIRLNKNKSIFNELVRYFLEYSYNFTLKNEPLILTSKFKFSDNYAEIDNLQINNDSAIVVAGFNSNFKNPLTPVKNLNVYLKDFNFDDFKINDFFSHASEDLLYTDIESPQKTFHFLRNVKSETRILVNATNLTLREKILDNIALDAIIMPNLLRINSIKINEEEQAKINAKIDLYVGKLRPIINMVIEGSYLATEFFNIFEPSVKNDIDANKSEQTVWSNSLFETIKWNKFDGNIKTNIDRVQLQKLSMDDVKGEVVFVGGLMNIKNSSAKMFGGELKLNGSLRAADNYLSLAFSLNNAEFTFTESFEKRFFPNFAGPYSLGGTLFTSGKTPLEMIRNLNVDSKFAAKQISINNIALDEVVIAIARTKNTLDLSLLKTLEQSGANVGVTNFNTINGTVKINNGILVTPDLVFASLYTKGFAQIVMNLENLNIDPSSKIEASFVPYKDANSMIAKILLQGNFNSPQKTMKLDSVASSLNIKYQ
ncbi:MAG: AsmA family protein [Sphingobacteriia bacterium]|nr:AsmA family protein [Sphingobacteriia bacterium]